MPVLPPTTLPWEWVATESGDGATELRIRARGRGFLIGVPLLLAVAIAARAFTLWPLPKDQVAWSAGVGAFFVLFAIWCAYARVCWRIGPGFIEHHLDFGSWRRVRRYENAGLEIVTGRTSQDEPFYRLFAVVEGKRHFLFERSMDEIVQLARYLSARTGFKTF